MSQDQSIAKPPKSSVLVFKVGKEKYGIFIEKVIAVTSSPHIAPVSQKTINNNTCANILDIKKKFNLERIKRDNYTVHILFKENDENYGFEVDSVIEVVEIKDDTNVIYVDTDANPTIGMRYITGAIEREVGLIYILNTSRLVEEFSMN